MWFGCSQQNLLEVFLERNIFFWIVADRRSSGAGLGLRSTLEQLEGAWGDDPRWAALDVPAKAKCVTKLVQEPPVVGSSPGSEPGLRSRWWLACRSS